MKITVKILNGQESTLEVSQTEPVTSVKRIVAQNMGILVESQRLVFKGKTLSDSSCLHDYCIKDGDKIHLFIKKTTEPKVQPLDNDFWHQLRISLKKHFTDSDAEKVIRKYKEDLDLWVKQLSLDDIERLARVHLEEQQAHG